MFDRLAAARDALGEIARTLDVSALSGPDALRLVEEAGAVRRVVDAILAKAAMRVDGTEAYAARGDRSAAAFVSRSVGIRTGEARSEIETARKLEHLAATDAAVRSGRLSSRHARMIAEVAEVNPGAEQELIDTAGLGLVPLRDACIAARARVEEPGARAARQHAQRCLHSWTDIDGMVVGHYRLAPEIGGAFESVIRAEVQRIFRAKPAGTRHEPLHAYAADALAAFVLGGGQHDGMPGDGVEGVRVKGVDARIHILIDHGALLRGGAVEDEVCEIPGVGPVDVAWVRELLGSAFLTAVIRDGKDIKTVAHLGRHVPAEVQTALLVGGRECDVEGCHSRGYLERDHVHEHGKGGPTSFHNLCWLCYHHHRLKSAGWLLGPPDPATRKRKLRPPPARAA
jgi:hypothetical protein